MKVISKSKGEPATCRKCRTDVLLEPGDVKLSSGYSMGEYDIDYYWKCPYCKTHNSTKHYYLAKK